MSRKCRPDPRTGQGQAPCTCVLRATNSNRVTRTWVLAPSPLWRPRRGGCAPWRVQRRSIALSPTDSASRPVRQLHCGQLGWAAHSAPDPPQWPRDIERDKPVCKEPAPSRRTEPDTPRQQLEHRLATSTVPDCADGRRSAGFGYNGLCWIRSSWLVSGGGSSTGNAPSIIVTARHSLVSLATSKATPAPREWPTRAKLVRTNSLMSASRSPTNDDHE